VKLLEAFTEPPFLCKNEGWGEFEMSIDLYITDKGKQTIFHDLNFASAEYENIQTVGFRNPSKALLEILNETGPVPSDEPAAKKPTIPSKKRRNGWDIEKMGDAMCQLDEDNLLHVIQMIHDNKGENSFTKNDIENGEYTVDLLSLPDTLLKMVWDFLVSHPCLPQFSEMFNV
jgi:transcription initiation factor IIF auxiliary subunit